MMKSNARRGRAAASSSPATSMIEGLEGRRMLSASPAAVESASPLVVRLMPATSGKIIAGKTCSQTVAIRNVSAASKTEVVTITLAPSLDRTTPAGSYSTPTAARTVTIEGHRTARLKVPFVVPATMPAGKYHTLATVQIGGTTICSAAPGAYTVPLTPAITTSPNLVGDYFGTISAIGMRNGHTMMDVATFDWDTTDQTSSCLNGYFSVGTVQTAGTMNGAELNTGRIRFTLASDNIKYIVKGRVMHGGTMIKGSFSGKLADNIFPALDGRFKIIRQTS